MTGGPAGGSLAGTTTEDELADAPATHAQGCGDGAADDLDALLPRAARSAALRLQWALASGLLAVLAVIAALYVRG